MERAEQTVEEKERETERVGFSRRVKSGEASRI